MIERRPINPERVRKITGSFSFIEHRFLRDGFFQSLSEHDLLLYFFLILVGDRQGLSYYSYDKICMLLRITVDAYILARDALIQKDLIAFVQVLSLPDKAADEPPGPLKAGEKMCQRDPAVIHQIIVNGLRKGDPCKNGRVNCHGIRRRNKGDRDWATYHEVWTYQSPQA